MKATHPDTTPGTRLWPAVLAIAAVCVSGCGNSAAPERNMHAKTAPLTRTDLEALSKKTLFFGHQSVGQDIVQGVQDILRDHQGISWEVIAAPGTADVKRPALVHSAIGKNGEPEVKLRDFAARFAGGAGNGADVAFFKFCYVDVNRDTDVPRLFARYRSAMDDLAKAHPRTRFIHLTVPLKATGQGWKAQIKNLIGRPDWFIPDNVRREEFNRLLRAEYGQRDVLFDLAMFEATTPDGRLVHDKVNGEAIPALFREYTYDTGHLNERGRRYVAERFLSFLARL